ncbi:phage tail protein [Aequorivita sp. SDUM287046]|uniref:Phage tail protein n=1 Tax=Aequorivita aurantiaca TaxID=3053356 RepID=A0ABT8DH96_9FLAO|nr:phage tail protein [Aequorivita aurantiaca]MDN3724766.1 phage tail protein [Aequorivita aurantiaca]
MDNILSGSFNFRLSFDKTSSKEEIIFSSISGITMVLDSEKMNRNGSNSLKPNISSIKYSNLFLKKGLARKNSVAVIWFENSLGSNFKNSKEVKNLTLQLIDIDGTPLKQWQFINAYPVNWTISVDQDFVAIESLELVYGAIQ